MRPILLSIFSAALLSGAAFAAEPPVRLHNSQAVEPDLTDIQESLAGVYRLDDGRELRLSTSVGHLYARIDNVKLGRVVAAGPGKLKTKDGKTLLNYVLGDYPAVMSVVPVG